jgi:hypothetical protein
MDIEKGIEVRAARDIQKDGHFVPKDSLGTVLEVSDGGWLSDSTYTVRFPARGFFDGDNTVVGLTQDDLIARW